VATTRPWRTCCNAGSRRWTTSGEVGMDPLESGRARRCATIRQTRRGPPTPEDSLVLEAAWAADPDLGVLVWVAMVTGARRGELCGLRWPHIRLSEGYLLIARSVVQRGGERREKDTKTHQARRVALDERAVVILMEHRARCEARAEACGVTIRSGGYVFSLAVDGLEPVLPDSVIQRIHRLSERLGVRVTLRGLRHYALRRCWRVGWTSERLRAGSVTATVARRRFASIHTSCPHPINGRPNCSREPVPHPQPSKE
jgi:integrase